MGKYESSINHLGMMAYHGKLSFFIGTGFSISLSIGYPTWGGLLFELCKYNKIDWDKISKFTKINSEGQLYERHLRNENIASLIPFYIIKQNPQFTIQDIRKQVKENIISILNGYKPNEQLIKYYASKIKTIKPNKIITTNYDDFIENTLGEDCVVITKYKSYDASHTKIEIIKIHGSKDNVDSLVFFEEEYFKFNNDKDYFYNKVYTTLHENTVLFIGYSLTDPNIRHILFELNLKDRVPNNTRKIIMLKEKIDDYSKDLFENVYGVEVIDEVIIGKILSDIAAEKENVENLVKKFENLEKNLPAVVDGKKYDLFLQNIQFFEELIKLFAAKRNLINNKNIEFLLELLNKKQSETYEKNAFAEYGLLAQFLIIIGESNLIINEINVQNFNNEYLRLFRYVVGNSRHFIIGYSWSAYITIKLSYKNISRVNRDYIENDKVIKDELLRIVI